MTAVAEPRRYDLAVIGAGPAGMAGAAAAAEGGLRVALIDAGQQFGGQFYRHAPEGLDEPWAASLQHGWEDYQRLVSAVEGSRRIDVLFGHQVFSIERGFTVHTDRGPVEAAFVLLATGAYERVLPFPGWDLPGVYTAGGAQALLKGSLVPVGRRVVVAGTGPLLLPVAVGLKAAGAEIAGFFEAGHFRGYARHPGSLLTNPRKVAEGVDYARRLAQGRVRPRSGFQVVAALGIERLETVVVARADGSGQRRIDCDALAVGHGLVPQIDLGLTLGCDHQVFADGTVGLRVDENQRTSVSGLYAAGETVGIAGAQTALVEGELAGRYIARHGTRGLINSLKRQRSRQRAFAEVIRLAHPVPATWRDAVTPETVVCRCEEVPASRITEAVTDLGATDARTVKLLTRAGMGWCQGRMCGYAVACLTRTDRYGQPSPQDVLAAARRPMSRPVALSVLAAYETRAVEAAAAEAAEAALAADVAAAEAAAVEAAALAEAAAVAAAAAAAAVKAGAPAVAAAEDDVEVEDVRPDVVAAAFDHLRPSAGDFRAGGEGSAEIEVGATVTDAGPAGAGADDVDGDVVVAKADADNAEADPVDAAEPVAAARTTIAHADPTPAAEPESAGDPERDSEPAEAEPAPAHELETEPEHDSADESAP